MQDLHTSCNQRQFQQIGGQRARALKMEVTNGLQFDESASPWSRLKRLLPTEDAQESTQSMSNWRPTPGSPTKAQPSKAFARYWPSIQRITSSKARSQSLAAQRYCTVQTFGVSKSVSRRGNDLISFNVPKMTCDAIHCSFAAWFLRFFRTSSTDVLLNLNRSRAKFMLIDQTHSRTSSRPQQ